MNALKNTALAVKLRRNRDREAAELHQHYLLKSPYFPVFYDEASLLLRSRICKWQQFNIHRSCWREREDAIRQLAEKAHFLIPDQIFNMSKD